MRHSLTMEEYAFASVWLRIMVRLGPLSAGVIQMRESG